MHQRNKVIVIWPIKVERPKIIEVEAFSVAESYLILLEHSYVIGFERRERFVDRSGSLSSLRNSELLIFSKLRSLFRDLELFDIVDRVELIFNLLVGFVLDNCSCYYGDNNLHVGSQHHYRH